MSIQNYVLLSEDATSVVQAPVPIDSDVFSSWVAHNNPKAARFRPISMVAQPAHDSSAETVVQNGWTITADTAQPNWQIVALDPDTVQQLAAQALYDALMSGNVVSTLSTAIDHWAALSPAQKDNVLLLNTKILRALLKARFGVNN